MRTWLANDRVQLYRDWTVIDQLHLHHRAEHAIWKKFKTKPGFGASNQNKEKKNSEPENSKEFT